MLRGIIFDLDGVIINSHAIHQKAWTRFLFSVGKEVSDAELEFVLDGRKREDILRHFLGELTDEQVKAYGQQKEALFREEALEIYTIEGVPEFLDELEQNDIAFALASSGSQSRVTYILERLHLFQRFRAVVTGDDVPHGKPHPAIFQWAAKKIQLRRAELLAVEDAVSGVRAAKSAGMKCLGVANGEHARALLNAGADQVISSFRETSIGQILELFGKRSRTGLSSTKIPLL